MYPPDVNDARWTSMLKLLYRLQLHHYSVSSEEWRVLSQQIVLPTFTNTILFYLYPLSLYVLLVYQISSVQMFNHSWQVTFFCHQTLLSVGSVSVVLVIVSCEKLGGWISQNSSQYQIDNPLIIAPLTIDNGHEAGYAKDHFLSGAELLWWSGQFLNHVRMLSANHTQQTD